MLEYAFTAEVFRWQADAAWRFLEVPEELSDEIRELTRGMTGGFGSVRVQVTIGDTTWGTSLFPSKERGVYVLPVKAAVRKAEGIADGDEVDVVLRT